MSSSVILLHGGSVGPEVNLGDQLMLLEVIRRLRMLLGGDVKLSIRPEAGPYGYRAPLGLYQYLKHHSRRRLSGLIGYPVIKRYRQTFGIVTDSDLSAVVNFMGYRYFDVGSRETKIDAEEAAMHLKLGISTILLPQAYGPFSTEELRKDAVKLFTSCRRVYARDSASAKAVESLGVETPTVIPDITIGTENVESRHPDLNGKVCVIPNLWMIERVSPEEAAAYVDLLVKAIHIARSLGLESFVLCHAPFQDRQLAEQVRSASGMDMELVEEDSPLYAKAIIGNCKFVIGSRYHGLLAALSQNVPVIATSWAHKYQGLMEDYNCPEFLIRPTEYERVKKLVVQLSDHNISKSYREIFAEKNKEFRDLIDKMWEEIAEMCDT